MTNDVLVRRLVHLQQLLTDLAPYECAKRAKIEAEHYKIERILELLSTRASDVIFHLLGDMGHHPATYREAFEMAADYKLIPATLSDNLQQANELRHVLVHMPDTIDYGILHTNVTTMLRDFRQFVVIFSQKLEG